MKLGDHPQGDKAHPDLNHAKCLSKDSVFWFADGSLILHVQDHLFRIHRTLLSRYSPFFAQAQNISFDAAGIEVSYPVSDSLDVDLSTSPGGCSYIPVDPDRGVLTNDVEVLLSHLYHDAPLASDTSFSRVASLLRVTSGHQLDFPAMHALAKTRFEAMFPGRPVSFSRPDNLEAALALATEYQIASIQKSLLYSLMALSNFDAEISRPLDEHSEEISESPPLSELDLSDVSKLLNGEHDAHEYTVSQADAERCTQLMTRIIEHFTPILFTPAATPHMSCTDVFADTWMQLVIQPAIEDDEVYKPFETLERLKAIDWAKHGLCQSCVKEKHEEWTEEQETVWKMMDSWLGLKQKDSPS